MHRQMAERRDRLAGVQRFAEFEERAAAQRLAGVQQSVEEQVQRLAELRQYRASYLSRTRSSGRWDAAQLSDYHEFLGRLDAAIRAQEEIVAYGRQRCDAERQLWSEKRQRKESVGRLAERFAAARRIRDGRRQQRELDEFASRKVTRPGFDD
jgi:flagellar FliJ protein